MGDKSAYVKGRGAQKQVNNPYNKKHYTLMHPEGIDQPGEEKIRVQTIRETPKKVVNKVTSPDVGMGFSLNPYQGCEHGCIYCYARNSHQYWGYNAGLDFERKIIVKENAPEKLKEQLNDPQWKPVPILLSGNTDCYQPLEKKWKITRRLLKVFAEYHHPVQIITKNSLILRDLDILKILAKESLVQVSISITTLNEPLRRKMEPRTASGAKRMQVISELSQTGIPVRLMNAPVIPGLNDHEIPQILREAAENGALSAGYTLVRLNGTIAELFEDWIRKVFPSKATKVLKLIRQCYGGQVNDSQWGRRMKGSGPVAEMVRSLFNHARKTYFQEDQWPEANTTSFKRPLRGQLDLFTDENL